MKTFCEQCGCHFPEDFAETQHPDCKWWDQRSFPPNFAVEHEEWAKKLWDHFFGFDHDGFGNATGLTLAGMDIKCSSRLYAGNQFEGEDPGGPTAVPGYKDWPDEKRRHFQKSWFRHYYSGIGKRVFDQLYTDFCEKWDAEYDGEVTTPRNVKDD